MFLKRLHFILPEKQQLANNWVENKPENRTGTGTAEVVSKEKEHQNEL